MPSECRKRIKLLRRRLSAADADALVVTHLPNIYYLSGFTGSSGALVVEHGRTTLFTDGRYAIQAPAQTAPAGARAEITKGPLPTAVGAHLASRKRIRAVYDPARVTVAAQKMLEKAAGRAVRWRAEVGWTEALRAIKSAAEIAQMRKAARLGSQAFEQTVKVIRPGITEIELAAEIEYRMRKLGAEGPSFETIVASGPRGALPHAHPTGKRLRRNELVVLDLGAILARYCCDLTRTVFLGRAPARVRRWYRAVSEARQAACEALAVGAKAGAPDAAARQVLAAYDLSRYFTHSTGHGLGLEVHEEPRLAAGQTREIEAGNVVTIEPGVYVEGVGGIRIEDDVAVHSKGIEVLTTAPLELLEL
jgi:Xaa-Pro aminopeptidase